MNKPLASVFQYCPQCGTAATAPGVNPFVCSSDACAFTYYFSPITAVGAIVSDSQGRVLFIRRANDPGKGKLGVPGGFVDAGEPLEDAVIREIYEETNLTTVAVAYLTSFPNTYVYKGVALDVTDMFFKCDVESFDPLFARDGEAAGFHLVVPTRSDLEDMAFESNRRALQMYLELLDRPLT